METPTDPTSEKLNAEAIASLPGIMGASQKDDGESEWTALCPSHNDSNASLWIADGDYRTVVKCSAGCPEKTILGALGLTVGDLSRSEGNESGLVDPNRRPSAEERDDAAQLSCSLPRREIERWTTAELTDPSHMAGQYLLNRFSEEQVLSLVNDGLLGFVPETNRIAFAYGDGADSPYRCVQFRAANPEAGTRWISSKGSRAVLGMSRKGLDTAPVIVTEGLSDGLAAHLYAPKSWGVAVVRGAGQTRAMVELVSLVGFNRPVVLVSDFDDSGKLFAESNIERLTRWNVPAVRLRPQDLEELAPGEKPVKDLSDFSVQYGFEACKRLILGSTEAIDEALAVIEGSPRSAFADDARIDDQLIEEHFFDRHAGEIAVDEMGMPLIRVNNMWAEMSERDVSNLLNHWIHKEVQIIDAQIKQTIKDSKNLGEEAAEEAKRLSKWMTQRADQLNSVRNVRHGKQVSKAIIDQVRVKAAAGQEHKLKVKRLNGGPGLLSVNSGDKVLDLTTGEILDGVTSAEAGCQSHTRTEWRGVDEPCPEWDAFLERCLPDPAVRDALQEAIGYAAVGEPDQNIAWFLVGEASSGKTRVLEEIGDTLGHYSTMIDDRLLNGKAHESETSALIGKRFVYLSDGTSGIISSDAIKKYASEGAVKGRKLYGNSFTFKSKHVLFLQSNFDPRFTQYDNGTLRRVIKIAFNEPYDPDKDTSPLKGKLSVKKRLELERSGILAWIVRGAMRYFKHAEELVYNSVLLESTTEAINENDPHREFLTSCDDLAAQNDDFLTNDQIKSAWLRAYPDARQDSGSNRERSAILKARGWMSKRTSDARGFSPPSNGGLNATYKRIQRNAASHLGTAPPNDGGNTEGNSHPAEDMSTSNAGSGESDNYYTAEWQRLSTDLNTDKSKEGLIKALSAYHWAVANIPTFDDEHGGRIAWIDRQLQLLGGELEDEPSVTMVAKLSVAIAKAVQ